MDRIYTLHIPVFAENRATADGLAQELASSLKQRVAGEIVVDPSWRHSGTPSPGFEPLAFNQVVDDELDW